MVCRDPDAALCRGGRVARNGAAFRPGGGGLSEPARFEAIELGCRRGGRAVFGGLGFAVEAGGALVLHGPNGAGKSSLLRILAGLLRPASGRLLWNGAPLGEDAEAHRARLHYVGHLDALKPLMTPRETLRFCAAMRGETARVDEALERLGLAALADMPGRYLSAGQKRRVALARLAASPAMLWLIDEPSVTLDAEATAALEAMMAAHRAAGGMIVLATHTGIAMEGAARLDLARFAATPARAAAGFEDETW